VAAAKVKSASLFRKQVKWISLFAFLVAGAAARADNPYREAARNLLERKCGDCHRADSPRAQEKALAVFTLNEADWSRRMTTRELQDALDRIAGGDASKDEVAAFSAFVKTERARRAAATR
jgi:hypothetical protein